jgi:hypothetical protein
MRDCRSVAGFRASAVVALGHLSGATEVRGLTADECCSHADAGQKPERQRRR